MVLSTIGNAPRINELLEIAKETKDDVYNPDKEKNQPYLNKDQLSRCLSEGHHTMNVIKTTLFVLIILCLSVSAVSASISVNNMAVSPSGDLVSGQNPPTSVTATFGIEFDSEGGETFPSSDSLLMATDLDNAKWSYIVVLDDNPNPEVDVLGKNVNINGWILSYPSKRDLAMKVTLNGDVPAVNSSGNITVVRVADISSKGTPVKGSEDITVRNVINPADKAQAVTDVKTQLAQFRSAIDAKSGQGVDTSAAAQKYSEAGTEIQNADKAYICRRFPILLKPGTDCDPGRSDSPR